MASRERHTPRSRSQLFGCSSVELPCGERRVGAPLTHGAQVG